MIQLPIHRLRRLVVQSSAACLNKFQFRGSSDDESPCLSMLVSCLFVVQMLRAPPNGAADDYNTIFKPMKWRSIGPFRGGRSVAGTGVVGDPKTYYMGTTGGGLWKTDDMGISWRNISDGYFKTGSVGAIAVAESDPNVVYVGMGEHAVRGVMTHHGDGVYKSTDAGKTWKTNRTGIDVSTSRASSSIRKTQTSFSSRRRARLYSKSKERGLLQIDRRRRDLEERFVRGRQDRRRGTVDGHD